MITKHWQITLLQSIFLKSLHYRWGLVISVFVCLVLAYAEFKKQEILNQEIGGDLNFAEELFHPISFEDEYEEILIDFEAKPDEIYEELNTFELVQVPICDEGDIIVCYDFPSDDPLVIMEYVRDIPPPPPPPPPLEEDEIICIFPREIHPVLTQCAGNEREEEMKCTQRKMLSYIFEHLKYPPEACVEGTMFLRLQIDTMGSIFQSDVLRPIGGGLSDSLQMVGKKMQEEFRFEPAIYFNKRVPFTYTFPIRIKLDNNEYKEEKEVPPPPVYPPNLFSSCWSEVDEYPFLANCAGEQAFTRPYCTEVQFFEKFYALSADLNLAEESSFLIEFKINKRGRIKKIKVQDTNQNQQEKAVESIMNQLKKELRFTPAMLDDKAHPLDISFTITL